MIHIAIVDDDKHMLGHIKTETEKQIFQYDIDYSIKTFSDSEVFMKTLKSQTFDLVLLDIDMPKINGLQLSECLLSRGKKTAVIFISSHDELMVKAFGFNVFSFINKERIRQDLGKNLRRLLSISSNGKKINVKTEGGCQQIPLFNIIAITLENRKIYIYLLNGSKIKIFATTLLEIMEQINSCLFMKINRSTIINIKYIESTKKSIVRILDRPDLTFEVSDAQKGKLDKMFMLNLMDDNYGYDY